MRNSVTWFIQGLLLINRGWSLAFQSTVHIRVCTLKFNFFFPRHCLRRTLQKVLNEIQNKTIKHLWCIILFGVLSFFPYIKSLEDILKSLCGFFLISCGGLNNNGPLGTDIWKLSHQGNDTTIWEGVGSVALWEDVCHWVCTLKPLKFLQPTLGHSALCLSRSGCGTFSDFSNTMSATHTPHNADSPQCWPLKL